MASSPWTIRTLRQSVASGVTRPTALADLALAHSSQNPSHNTYLWQDAAWTRKEAARAEAMEAGEGGAFGDGRSAIWGLPISVKDCFDLAGAPTSCGVRYYRDLNGVAAQDSWLVKQLRDSGAVIIGKSHLHPLAYGITGENPEFGDCLQPGDATALTGGSSSGAVASVMEGSAVAAIGTDTGGSVRVPASFSGLAGYRASHGRGDWQGVAHLAESFDKMGWLFRDLEDASLLSFPFAPDKTASAAPFSRFATVSDSFLDDCEPVIVESFYTTIRELEMMGLERRIVDPTWWADSREIFVPIQAWEAARLHAGSFAHFEPSIRERLEKGASVSPDELATLRKRHDDFRSHMHDMFAANELVILPCAPVAKLTAGADHSQTRIRLLRYTAPFSLAGVPTVAIPCKPGGMQLAAGHGRDEQLLKLASQLGAYRKSVKAGS